MFRLLKMGKSFVLLAIFIPLMTITSYIIYLEYVKTKENVFEIIQTHLIDEKLQLFKNYSNYIIVHLNKDIKGNIEISPDIAKHYEDELRLLKGDEIRYLYLLYKDKEDKFRYLLDSTMDINEKAEYNQRFDPITTIWDMAYKTKSLQIIYQKDLDALWVTIAYPLIADGKVIAVLGADFTYDVYSKIVNTLNPMERIYFYIAIFMSVMLRADSF